MADRRPPAPHARVHARPSDSARSLCGFRDTSRRAHPGRGPEGSPEIGDKRDIVAFVPVPRRFMIRYRFHLSRGANRTMPRKSWSIGGGIGALALITVVIALQGCDGNSSPSGNFLAACETGCNKEAACLDASSPNAKSFCVSSCTTANSLMTAQRLPELVDADQYGQRLHRDANLYKPRSLSQRDSRLSDRRWSGRQHRR